MDKQTVFSHIDHTILKADATWEQVDQVCKEAVDNGMASACIPPRFVKRAKEKYGNRLAVCTVIGFPLGYNTTRVKVFEAQQAVLEGADELDMVIHIGDAKAGDFDRITEEIREVKAACGGKILKVIVETCALSESEKEALCACVSDAGADYIKTSTGFGTGGATPEDIELFKKHIAPEVKMKASGGIRTKEAIEGYIKQGCARIGASSALKAYEDQ
ncbi:MAG: deoxyribose-phosphate aldolase [Christensenellales bacterium]|jgi:deoxyribose-phosphate aldolase|nr:deoxyribose-phosphate aldolase [Clostridiales bacterium]